MPDEAANTYVDVVTLDDDLDHLGRIDLVKIDVEGAEAAVLAGMDGLLRSGRVNMISCEVRSDAFERQGLGAEWPHSATAWSTWNPTVGRSRSSSPMAR